MTATAEGDPGILDLSVENPLHQHSDDDTAWTTVNAAENIPGVPTPLGYTFWFEAGDRGLKGGFADFGVIPESEVRVGEALKDCTTGIFYGRFAGNMTLFRRLADQTPGTSGDSFEKQIFGAVRPGQPVHTSRRRYPVIAVRAPWTVLRLPRRVAREADAMLGWWRTATSEAGQERPGIEQVRDAVAAAERAARTQMSASIVAQGLFDRLASLTAAAGLPDLHLELSTGYGGLEEIEMVAALHRVAHDGASLAEFLAVYGSRAVSEMELSTPSWRENPATVERLVQKYRDAPDRVEPGVRMRASAAARIDAERRLLAALPLAGRVSARLLLTLARRHIPLREVGKSTLSKAMDGGRVAVRARGREIVAAGHIDTVEDVFYLTIQEILTEPPAGARALIVHRRALRAAYEKIDVPKVWVGNPEPVVPEPPTVERVTELSGVGAAFGVVEGRARVVLDADGCDDLEADEILVCRTTDPSWATAFHLVAATVIDIGGPASHGAIVSREMGLPCVINTGDGTKVLRTGDLLRVDGNAGLVTVLEAAG